MYNPKLSVGDRVVCYAMEDEISVPPGTKGTVKNIVRDPFEPDSEIISVEWDNGSTLALLSSHDRWKLAKPKITEQVDSDPHASFIAKNREIRRAMDLPYFREYFKTLQKSGITNMFGASPFVYMDSEHLERYHGENREDDENFQALLNIQDETRAKFLSQLVNYANQNNINLEDDHQINRLAQKLSKKLLEFYMTFYE